MRRQQEERSSVGRGLRRSPRPRQGVLGPQEEQRAAAGAGQRGQERVGGGEVGGQCKPLGDAGQASSENGAVLNRMGSRRVSGSRR